MIRALTLDTQNRKPVRDSTVRELLRGSEVLDRARHIYERMEYLHNKDPELYGADAARFSLFMLDSGLVDYRTVSSRQIGKFYDRRKLPYPFIRELKRTDIDVQSVLKQYSRMKPYAMCARLARDLLTEMGFSELADPSANSEGMRRTILEQPPLLYRMAVLLESIENLATPVAMTFAYIELFLTIGEISDRLKNKRLDNLIKSLVSEEAADNTSRIITAEEMSNMLKGIKLSGIAGAIPVWLQEARERETIARRLRSEDTNGMTPALN